MANIQTYLEQIKNAIYGKDVRQAIYDAIHQCYQDGRSGSTDLVAREQIQNLSNPNLLINGDFQVWQRGETFENVSPNSYTADRWKNTKLNTQNLSVEKVDGGMKLTTTESRTVITQYIEGRLLNEDYTLSLSLDGVTLATTFNVTDTTWTTKDLYHDGEKVAVVAFQVQNSNFTSIEIYIQKQVAVLNWVKLEKGSLATPFIPRTYHEELALCESYYYKGDIVLTKLYQYTTGELVVKGTFKKMRSTPTISFTYIATYNNSSSIMTTNTFEIMPSAEDIVTAKVKFDETINTTSCGCWAWIVCDAEIY